MTNIFKYTYLNIVVCIKKRLISRKQIIKHIRRQFSEKLGYDLNLYNPETFNEKLQWLKIYYKNPLLTICADKFKVRDYVKEKIGEKYLINLLGVYDRVDEVDLDNLPNKFVLKINHGSGQNIICKDKNSFNREDAKNKLINWIKPFSNHYYYSYEWSYKNIKPKIVCEEYLEQIDGNLLDYKVLCFNGLPKFIWVDIDRFGNHRRNFYDTDWNYLNDFQLEYPNDSSVHIEKPSNLAEILKISRILSSGFPHVRVDLYLIDEKIYFGELTFYSENGMGKFEPFEWDQRLGKMLNI